MDVGERITHLSSWSISRECAHALILMLCRALMILMMYRALLILMLCRALPIL